MSRAVFIAFTYLISLSLFANNDRTAQGARSTALGNISVMHANVFSVSGNQAGLAFLDRWTAGVYAENRFLIKDLGFYSAQFAYPTKSGTFGLGINYFGSSLYNEKNIKLAYGRLLFEKLAIGIELDYIGFHVAEYGSKSIFTFGLGLQYQLLDNIKIGAHIFNPIRYQLTENEDDRLPIVMKWGMSYEPSEKAGIYFEIEKNISHAPAFKGGIEYRIIDELYLRAGFGANPTLVTMGIGIQLKSLDIDVAGGYHPTLGYSPQVSITYSGRKKN